jgi:hypothetical protein
MLRMHRGEIYNGIVIDIRSLPKGRSPPIITLFLFSFNHTVTHKVPRSVNDSVVVMPALPFVRSMGPNTRNVFDATSHQTQGDLAMPHLWQSWPKNTQFWPHGHSMPPRSKNSWNFRNFIAQRIKINFYFYFNKFHLLKIKNINYFFISRK